MNLLELGALAQIAGAIAIIISLILVLIELRKTLHLLYHKTKDVLAIGRCDHF